MRLFSKPDAMGLMPASGEIFMWQTFGFALNLGVCVYVSKEKVFKLSISCLLPIVEALLNLGLNGGM